MRSAILSMCKKYASMLACDSSGSKVLYEAIACFFPQPLIQAVLNVYTGIENDDDGMDEEEDAGDDDDNDNDDDDDDDEEEEEEEEEEEGADMDVPDEDNDDDEDGDLEGLTDEYLEDSTEPMQADAKTDDDHDGAEGEAVDEIPIHEDSTAHGLLKKLCALEVDVEGNAEAVDRSHWEDADAPAGTQIALPLLRALKELGKLDEWAACNRGCHSLVHISSVPSAQAELKKCMGEKSMKAAVKKSAGAHSGGKLLSEKLSSM
jgi:hypothetical protein